MCGYARVWGVGVCLLMAQWGSLHAQSAAWTITSLGTEQFYPFRPSAHVHWAQVDAPSRLTTSSDKSLDSPFSEPAYRGHEQAIEAVRRGEAKPLRQILQHLYPQYPGRILRVQFHFDPHFHVWVYDIRMLQEDKILLRLKVDALTAEVLRVRGRHKSKKGH